MWRDDGSLLDILNAARSIQSFTKDVDEERFLRDELVQSAVIRQFEIIGEASGRISTGFVVDHPAIPWREMVSMRNRLIHGYDVADRDLVWDTIREDLPALVGQLEEILEGIQPPD